MVNEYTELEKRATIESHPASLFETVALHVGPASREVMTAYQQELATAIAKGPKWLPTRGQPRHFKNLDVKIQLMKPSWHCQWLNVLNALKLKFYRTCAPFLKPILRLVSTSTQQNKIKSCSNLFGIAQRSSSCTDSILFTEYPKLSARFTRSPSGHDNEASSSAQC